MRVLRRAVVLGKPLVGMAIVLGGVLFVPRSNLQLQIVVVLVGVLILEAGVWGLTGQLLPNERTFGALRSEGEHFVGLIRDLNRAATAREIGEQGNDLRFDEALAAMHQSVDRMGGLAGKKRGPEDDQVRRPSPNVDRMV